MIIKQSSPVLMKPSKESCLCWLNCTFLPIWLKSKTSGGSEIIIFKHNSPNFYMNSEIWLLMSSDSLSEIAKTCCILFMRPSQIFLFTVCYPICLQLLWYFFLSTLPIEMSNFWVALASLKAFSTGQKCFSMTDTICGNEF